MTIQPSLNTGNISVHKSLQGWWISLTLYFNKLRSPLLYFNLVNYQILIDKKQTDLRKNTLSSLEGGSETVGKILNDIDKRVDFLLCPSCFWCATYFNFGELSIIRCPICHNNCIDQLPVSINKAWPYSLRNVIIIYVNNVNTHRILRTPHVLYIRPTIIFYIAESFWCTDWLICKSITVLID